jgi:protein TonB
MFFGLFDFNTIEITKMNTIVYSSMIITSDTAASYFNWQALLFLFWGIVSLILLVKLTVKYFCLKKSLMQFSNNKTNNIIESHSISSALAFGLFKPKVFLPTDHTFTIQQERLLVRHEEIHCQRKDPLIRILYQILTAIFWFHPIMHLINKYMKKDQELSCDEMVIKNNKNEVEYSKLLLQLSQIHQLNTNLSEHYCSSISMLKERIMLIRNNKNTYNNLYMSRIIRASALIGLVFTTASIAALTSAPVYKVVPQAVMSDVPQPPEMTKTPKSIKITAIPKPPKAAAEPKSIKVSADPKPPKVSAEPKSIKAIAAPRPPKVIAEPKSIKVNAAPRPPKVIAEPKPIKVTEVPRLPKVTANPKTPKVTADSKLVTVSTYPKQQKSPKIQIPTVTPEVKIQPLITVSPKYPRKAGRKKISGYVTMDLEITANGKVGNVTVVESNPIKIFDKAAIKSVKKWKYAPMDHKATVRQTINFKFAKSHSEFMDLKSNIVQNF